MKPVDLKKVARITDLARLMSKEGPSIPECEKKEPAVKKNEWKFITMPISGTIGWDPTTVWAFENVQVQGIAPLEFERLEPTTGPVTVTLTQTSPETRNTSRVLDAECTDPTCRVCASRRAR